MLQTPRRSRNFSAGPIGNKTPQGDKNAKELVTRDTAFKADDPLVRTRTSCDRGDRNVSALDARGPAVCRARLRARAKYRVTENQLGKIFSAEALMVIWRSTA